jgi:hypothetical protein
MEIRLSGLAKRLIWEMSELYRQLIPFYDMLEKGIIMIPRKDELISVPDICLRMKSPPSVEFIRLGINGHQYRYLEDTQLVSNGVQEYRI